MSEKKKYTMLKCTTKFDHYVEALNDSYMFVSVVLNSTFQVKSTHLWEVSYTKTWAGVCLSGKSKHENYCYTKCSIEVKIREFGATKNITTHQTCTNPPNYNAFSLVIDITNLKKKWVTTVITVTPMLKDKTRNFFECHRTMLDDGILTDLVIKVKDRDFSCHKFVLAAQSSYFRLMFQTDMKEKKEGVINWVDIFEADTVQDFLHYIYTGQTPPNVKETCMTLIKAADMCLLENLKKICAFHIKDCITNDNVADILKMSATFQSEELQETTVNFIVDNYSEDMPKPWKNLEPELALTVMNTIFKAMTSNKIHI